jgi:hypothetical protein
MFSPAILYGENTVSVRCYRAFLQNTFRYMLLKISINSLSRDIITSRGYNPKVQLGHVSIYSDVLSEANTCFGLPLSPDH